ncbi:MAG: hypothetical protein AAGJ35_07990, partial [Myxococcota bacterium]
MSTQTIQDVRALPLQLLYWVYSVFFGMLLFSIGISPQVTAGVTLVLLGLGFQLRRVRTDELPMALGVMYALGIVIAYTFLWIETTTLWVLVSLLGGLFVLGIVGNLFYFLSEKQKLSFLNGQIGEDRLTLRTVNRWFPLWLVLLGNVLLIFAVT